jgi:hypothetical protein
VTAAAGSDDLKMIYLRYGNECDDRVTIFAEVRRIDMGRRLPERFHPIVTVDAVASNVVMIEVGRNEAHSRVTVLACVSAENVIGVLTDSDYVVVAAHTRSEHLKVVDLCNRTECDNVVAVLADIGCRSVFGMLTDCFDAIVAIETIARNVVVTEISGNPGDTGVAIVAGIATVYMVDGFAIDDRIVVAADADTQHLIVIDDCNRGERGRRMAILTEVRRRNVSNMFAGRSDAVVATHAVRCDSEMIEEDREPSGRSVARIAFGLRHRVVGRLADGLYVIVACHAAAEYRIVIHFRERKPRSRAMAVFAKLGAENMICGFRNRLNPAARSMT